MIQSNRDFNKRSKQDQDWHLANAWCDQCNEADLGMYSPEEFEEDGRTFLKGKCNKCGRLILNEILEEQPD